jgi:hypothetical protein
MPLPDIVFFLVLDKTSNVGYRAKNQYPVLSIQWSAKQDKSGHWKEKISIA